MRLPNMYLKFKWIIFNLIVTAFLYTTITIAASLPANYPKIFMWVGEIENISSNSGKITISDREFFISPVISVTRLRSGSSEALSDLPKGLLVGCNYDSNGAVTEVWELPKEYADYDGTSLRSPAN